MDHNLFLESLKAQMAGDKPKRTKKTKPIVEAYNDPDWVPDAGDIYQTSPTKLSKKGYQIMSGQQQPVPSGKAVGKPFAKPTPEPVSAPPTPTKSFFKEPSPLELKVQMQSVEKQISAIDKQIEDMAADMQNLEAEKWSLERHLKHLQGRWAEPRMSDEERRFA